MKYRDMLGFPKKKAKKKIIPEPPKSSVANKLKEELNEWNDTTFKNLPKRWSKSFNSALTEFEQQGGKDNVNEGPAYEYEKITKDIEKKKEIFGMEVVKFIKLLKKKGLNDEGVEIAKLYNKYVTTFGLQFKKILRKLM